MNRDNKESRMVESGTESQPPAPTTPTLPNPLDFWKKIGETIWQNYPWSPGNPNSVPKQIWQNYPWSPGNPNSIPSRFKKKFMSEETQMAKNHYKQILENMINEKNMNEGVRRVERLRRSTSNALHRLNQFSSSQGEQSRVAGGLDFADINPRAPHMKDAIAAARERLNKDILNTSSALSTAVDKVRRSQATRAVAGSLRQAATGNADPQLQRIATAIHMSQGEPNANLTQSISSADANMRMAKGGLLPKSATRRLLGLRKPKAE